jgi:hypothetical protein
MKSFLHPKYQIHSLRIWALLTVPALLLMAGCVVSRPTHLPEKVFYSPGTQFSDYKDVAVFVDFTAIPEEQWEPRIVTALV